MHSTQRRVRLEGSALVIGISAYTRIPALPSVHDAEDIADVLRAADLCGYPAERVDLRVEAAATREAILEGLDRLVGSARASTSAFLYFSGHGGRLADGDPADAYLMPVDGTWRSPAELAKTAVSSSDIALRLRKIEADRVTIVLDCCRAAGIAEAKGAPSILPAIDGPSLASLAKGRGRAVLAASRADGTAYASPGHRNSVFTQHLLDGLRGGARGTGGVIRVCDLFDYVQQKVTVEFPDQRPVFKAELEENYPLTLHRGGESPPVVLPEAPDDCLFDAFVSYRRVAPDRAWVEQVLVPRLEGFGLRICLAHRDFRLGAPRIREMERAIERSRYTIAVLSPRYLEGAFEEFQAVLAQHQSVETRAPRFVPLLREPCRPALGIRTTEWLDVSDPELEDATVQRLAQRLREAYRDPAS